MPNVCGLMYSGLAKAACERQGIDIQALGKDERHRMCEMMRSVCQILYERPDLVEDFINHGGHEWPPLESTHG